MTRAVALALALLSVALVVYDANLAFDRLSQSAPPPINAVKVTVAIVFQCAALLIGGWYALFLASSARIATQPAIASLKAKLLPFVVPVVALLVSTTLLQIGLLCGEQSLDTRQRGGQVCPAK